MLIHEVLISWVSEAFVLDDSLERVGEVVVLGVEEGASAEEQLELVDQL